MRPRSESVDLFAGDSELNQLMRSHDWPTTPVGAVSDWPHSLQIAVRIMLGSRYAMWLGWGPELTFFYNDAYARMTLGAKHPWALGRSAREVWAEIWNDIGPRAESVLRTGKATWDEGLLLFLERHGFPEETYHTFSYSPLPDDQGGIGGMLCVVTEDTERAIGERRLKTLRELGARTTEEARSAEEACQTAVSTLAGNPHDLPFLLLYLLDATARTAHLAGARGLPPACPAAEVEIDLVTSADAEARWPLRSVLETGKAQIVANVARRLGSSPIGVYPEPPHTAVVLPLRQSGQDRLAGFLVAGVSPRRPFDEDYRGFLDLLAGQIGTAIANARAYEEERRRAEALAELDRAKTAFFANVSHEFRTPLTLLLGPVEDALARPGDDGVSLGRDTLALVHRNGLRLQKLVNTLLDFSRIEAGRAQASYEPMDLASFTAELASSFRSACERAGLELVVDCPPLAEPVHVDREMWEKIVLNLVSNAFKFTLAGRIDVSMRQTGLAVELTVRDTGTGIPPEQMPHLFERFHRVESARGRTLEGSGIGLALVRELVRLHGGDVRAESRTGEGTTFRVTVPLGTAHLPTERVRTARLVPLTALGATPYVEEALRWLPDAPQSPNASDPTPEAVPHLSGDRPLVLLADDNADMRDYIRRLLAGRYDVTTVADGMAARDALRRQVPDLLLTDVMMPGLDGFGLLRALRADPDTQGLPVILLSARAGEEARVEGLQAGADDYMTKPFSARELLARVASVLEIARLRREALDRERQNKREIDRLNRDLQRRVTEFQTLLEVIPIGIAVADDPECRRIWSNPAMCRLLGLQEKANISLSAPDDELPPFKVVDEGRELLPSELPMQTAIATGREVRGVKNEILLNDGTSVSLLNYAVPLFDEVGRIRGGLYVGVDVTEQERFQRALREAERRFRAVFNQQFQFMAILAPDGSVLEANDTCFHATGVERQQVLGQPFWDTPWWKPLPAMQTWWKQAIAEACHTAGPISAETDYALADGSVRHAAVVVTGMRDAAGCIAMLIVEGRDDTDRRRAETALRQSEQRWRTMAEALPNLLWTDLPDGQCDWLSSQWGKYTGIPESELLGLRWVDRVLHPDDRDRTLACWKASIEDRGEYDLEYRIRRHDGQYHWFKTRGVPLRDEAGQIVYWFGTCTDIEDQKQLVEQLRRSEAQLRELADAMPQIVYTAQADGRTEYFNRRWYEYTGLPEGEVSDASWLSVLHPDERPRCLAEAQRTIQAGIPFEMELRIREHGTGHYRWHLSRSIPVRDEAGQVMRWYGTSTNIDEQKRASEAARFLAEASAALATLVDDESTLQKVANLAVPYFADWSAVDLAQADGSLRRLAVAHRNAAQVEVAQQLFTRYPPDPEAAGGTGAVLRTGRAEILTEVHDEMLVRGAKDEEHLRLMRALQLRSYICVPLVASGETIGVLTFATAESGRHYARADLALAEDLAHRAAVAIDNARLYLALQEADRRKDEFLAVLAHELRNPLAPLSNALQVMRLTEVNNHTAQVRDMMIRQVQQMTRLVDDLLDVSRITRGKIVLRKERLDLADVILGALETSRPLIEAARHQLTVTPAPRRLHVEGDRTRLAQVLSNLLTNAAKYTPEGGHIGLTVASEGEWVILRVRDDGLGIPPDMLPRIFDMFTQVDRNLGRAQGGLGIGLTLVRNLVEMHGGRITASSAGPGCGSEFVVYLPLFEGDSDRSAGGTEQEPAHPPDDSKRRRILVVDDNLDSAESLRLMLSLQHNSVRTAHDGPSALATVATFIPDVVLLDIGLPGMDGYEVARRMRLMPALRRAVLIAQTGWGQEEDRRRSAEAGFNHHFTKPVDPAALEKLLSNLAPPMRSGGKNVP